MAFDIDDPEVSLLIAGDDDESIPSEDEDVFLVRFNCIQNGYLKMSWINKRKCLTMLRESVNDLEYLDILNTSAHFNIDKVMMYSRCQTTTNYIFDKRLFDHNRALDEHFLEKAIKSDYVWFNQLEPKDQVFTISELLRVSGGTQIRVFFDAMIKYLHKKRSASHVHMCTSAQQGSDVESDDEGGRKKKKKKRKGGKKDKKTKGKKKKKEEKIGETENKPEKPKTPLQLEVEQKRKVWDEAITKYRRSVEGKPRKSGKGKGKKGSKKGSKRGSKASKKSKGSKKSGRSSKSTKSGKKGKGKKNLVDLVQMLPVWIVKKIFNYLDPKTLNRVAEVNKYWDYVVDDIKLDKKCKAFMQKTMDKLMASQHGMSCLYPTRLYGEPPKLTVADRRMMKLADRGAVDERIRPIIKKQYLRPTLVERAVRHKDLKVDVPVKNYRSFPRDTPVDDSLVARPSCVLTEIGQFTYDRKPIGGAVTIYDIVSLGTISAAASLDGKSSSSFTSD